MRTRRRGYGGGVYATQLPYYPAMRPTTKPHYGPPRPIARGGIRKGAGRRRRRSRRGGFLIRGLIKGIKGLVDKSKGKKTGGRITKSILWPPRRLWSQRRGRGIADKMYRGPGTGKGPKYIGTLDSTGRLVRGTRIMGRKGGAIGMTAALIGSSILGPLVGGLVNKFMGGG